MSIFPLFLLLGVVYSRHISYYDNGAVLRPIMTRTEERRICAELCMSGLGGDPCGENCVDLTPQILPLQSNNKTSAVAFYGARSSACPTLCKNSLGYPLCQCDQTDYELNKKTDFVEVCGFYCLHYNYQLLGCQDCGIYKNSTHPEGMKMASAFSNLGVDWNLWCKSKCLSGDGGAACNCDLLPMSGNVHLE